MNKKEISKDKDQVSTMFNNIAPKYDFLNHFLSAGIDKKWRRETISKIGEIHPEKILDVATGTGDLAIKAAQLKPKQIIGVDIAAEMIAIGMEKIRKMELESTIELQLGDSLKLNFEDQYFDATMVAFGVRNFENLKKGLSEMHRVLKPGGMIAILEFSNPKKFPVKQFYTLYSKMIMPLIGRLISGHSSAYTYLPETVKQFPYGSQFATILSDVGFNQVNFKEMTFGIATLYTGIK